jgi:hypothetical protein
LITLLSSSIFAADLSCSAYRYVYNGVKAKGDVLSIYSTESGYASSTTGLSDEDIAELIPWEEVAKKEYQLKLIEVKKESTEELVVVVWIGKKRGNATVVFKRDDYGISFSTDNKDLEKHLKVLAPKLDCFMPL